MKAPLDLSRCDANTTASPVTPPKNIKTRRHASLKPSIQLGVRLAAAYFTWTCGYVNWIRHHPRQALRNHNFVRFAIVVVLISILAPILQAGIVAQRYILPTADLALVGSAAPTLVSKLGYDRNSDAFLFNQAAQSGQNGEIDHGIGDYQVSLPTQASHGIKITDPVSQLSFSLTPDFGLLDGQQSGGRVIYPLSDSNAALIYSIKANGLKEDVLLQDSPRTNYQLNYRLNLPPELEARLTSDGGVGIYGADAKLYGNISYASPADRAQVESARTYGAKNNLVFTIPAPTVNQSGAASRRVQASYQLKGDRLTLKAVGLNHASYPLSIDPSVIVNSTNQYGNSEFNIDSTAGITRATLTGGTLDGTVGWHSTTAFTGVRINAASVAYNGYMYLVGGTDLVSSNYTTVQRGTLVAGGGVSAWTNDATLTGTPSLNGSLLAYDNKLYYLGSGGECQIAAINPASGVLSPFAVCTNSPTSHGNYFTAISANGRLYEIGGATQTTSVEVATLGADGNPSVWTVLTGTPFPVTISNAASGYYNGYLYVFGGINTTSQAKLTSIYSAKVNSDGSLGTNSNGSWNLSANTILTGRLASAGYISDGYMYVVGGDTGGTSPVATVEYASLSSDGTVGPWNTTTSYTAIYYQTGVVYNDVLYSLGGCTTNAPSCTTGGVGVVTANAAYTKINSAGTPNDNTWTSSTTMTARDATAGIAYNGYLYIGGGCAALPCTSFMNDVQYAKINANGTLGTWTTYGTTFVTARGYLAMTAYNGYLYVGGGCSAATHAGKCNGFEASVEYSKINPDTGAFSTAFAATATAFTTASSSIGMTAYNGYLYVVGGCTATNNTSCTTFNAGVQHIALVTSTGNTTGVWTQDTVLPSTRQFPQVAAYNGYLYVSGGDNGTVLNDLQYGAISATNGNITSWSAATTAPGARYGGFAAIDRGYIYLGAGCSVGDPCTTYLGNVVFAKLADTGGVVTNGVTACYGATVTWCTASSTTTARELGAGAIHNGNLYVYGGYNGAALGDSQVLHINNGGDGAPGSWSTASPSLTTARYEHGAASYNNYVYVVGGCSVITSLCSNAVLSDVQYAQVNPSTGVLSSWTTNASFALPQALGGASITQTGNLVYVMGGYNGTAYQSTVYFARLLPGGGLDGSITCPIATSSAYWCATTNTWAGTVGARSLAGAVAYRGYMYAVGGYNGTSNLCDVWYAPIAATGDLGAWTSTTSVPSTGSCIGANPVASNGNVYLVGGRQSDGTTLNSSLSFAAVAPNGTVGTWATGAFNLPRPMNTQTIIADGFIYAIGGDNSTTGTPGTTAYNLNYFAPIAASGATGDWQASSTALPAVRGSSPIILTSGRLYSLGGNNANGTSVLSAAVYVGGLLAQPRIGSYSAAFDLGSNGLPTSLITLGNLGTSDSVVNLTQSYATSSANTFGSSTTSVISLGTKVNLSPTAESRTSFLQLNLDDSLGSTFPDNTSTQITELDYFFHPPSGARLHGGKTFTNQTQRSLDAPP